VQVSVLRSVLDTNDLIARENRKEFDAHNCFVVNLMSAPGSGKTTILERTLRSLDGRLRAAVIEGDVQGTLDADRLAPLGVPVVQINTDPHFGGECHLDARMIRNALPALDLDGVDVVLIENVGNLVCPAEFQVGEHRKVMVLSVTEGEDKPLKYPLMFRVSDLLLLNKLDLLEHLDVEPARFRANAARVNPVLPIIELSARTGYGFEAWVDWLAQEVATNATRGAPCGAI
jgi:hydrogenase nickel incorporation protein HypB